MATEGLLSAREIIAIGALTEVETIRANARGAALQDFITCVTPPRRGRVIKQTIAYRGR